MLKSEKDMGGGIERQKECECVYLACAGALDLAQRKRSYSIVDDVFGSDTKATAFEDVS